MGYSTWSDSDYTAYATNTSYRTLSRAEVFKSQGMVDSLDPAKFVIRESRDSAQNPKSTPVIFGLDVTGSMGAYCEAIAKTQLPDLMTDIHNRKVVTDPHIMFMGIGDVDAYDRAPVQVSQFEADLRIVEQLRELYLEGGGGANNSESYTFPWYVAAHCTATDITQKRNGKGFLFTMGDECVPDAITRKHLGKVFGARANNMPSAGSNAELLAEVSKSFHVFHIVVEEGSYYTRRPHDVRRTWDQLMRSSVLYMKDHRDLVSIVTTAMKAVQGDDLATMIDRAGNNSANLRHAFANVLA